MKEKNFNALLIIIFSSIIANIIAFVFQFLYHELPCPLCLLQRFGLLAICYGSIMALKSEHIFRYIFTIIISSIFTLIVALRQVLLHILPNNEGYGSIFLGLHFYTWSALLSFALIIIIAMAPLLDYINLAKYVSEKFIAYIQKTSYYLFVIICIINTVSAFLECGLTQCPDDPNNYIELS